LSDLLSTAVVPTVVSLIVTLAVNGVLGPWREAALARRRFRERLLSIALAAARIDQDRAPVGFDQASRAALVSEQHRVFEQLDAHTMELIDDLASAAGTYRWFLRDMIVNYAGAVRGAAISQRHQAEKARIVLELTRPLLEVVDGPLWRPIRKMRAIFALNDILKKYTGTDVVPAHVRKQKPAVSPRTDGAA
jgi:hypothetical protein